MERIHLFTQTLNVRRKPTKISRGGQAVRIQRRTAKKPGVEYTYWQLSWRENGKPRSTSRRTEEEARILADEIAVRLARGEIKQRILTGLELADYDEARAMCQEAGCSLLDAARFFRSEWRKRQIVKITVPELIPEFLTAKDQDGCGDRYLDDARLRLTKFSKAFTGQISVIIPREIDDYLRSLGGSNRSRNNVHTILGSFFSFARMRGYLPKTERTAMESVPRAKLKPASIGILTPEQFAAVLHKAGRKTLPAFVLGGFCGMRQSEICRLDWSSIFPERQLITANASITKTARRRIVPISDAAKAWLEPIAKSHGPVIEYSSQINLCIMMRPVWKAADVKPTQNCLRHSAASYQLALTGNAPQTAIDLGTSIKMLMEHYRELVTKEDAKTWFAIFPEIKEPGAQESPQTSPKDNPPTESDQKL